MMSRVKTLTHLVLHGIAVLADATSHWQWQIQQFIASRFITLPGTTIVLVQV